MVSTEPWRQGLALQVIYPEALRGLIALVERFVPALDQTRGPYSVFVELMRSNLSEWEKDRNARGHLVGMGMGSVYDIGGPYDHFPGGEEGFERFDDTLRWLHRISYRCAERWTKDGRRWTKTRDAALLKELGQPRTWLELRRCRACGLLLTSEQCLNRISKELCADLRLELLAKRGGPRTVRALMKPDPAPLRARKTRARAELTRLCENEGLRVVRTDDDLYPCPECGGDTVGTPRELTPAENARCRRPKK